MVRALELRGPLSRSLLASAALFTLVACGSNGHGASGTGGASSSSSSSSGTGGSVVSGTGGGAPVDLCAGLVSDQAPHPMTALAKPALGQTVIDPEFKTTIRRITAVDASGSDPVIKPMYSPTAAWNADETLLLLYHAGAGHELYDGKSYAFLKSLDIQPADIEQVWWDGKDPDIFYYVDGKVMTRYHASSGKKDALHTFSFCSGDVAADSHGFTSWGSLGQTVISLACDQTAFVYRIDADQILAQTTTQQGAPLTGADGKLVLWQDDSVAGAGDLKTQRTLAGEDPIGHCGLGLFANGHDTFNGPIYDPPNASVPAGALLTYDMTDGSVHPIIAQSNGWPYPPSAIHVSPLVFRQPGWVWVSIVGNTDGSGVLDQEIVLSDTNTGKVCRVAHHRSWGKDNTHLATPYFAEPHVTASPSGTRAVFGSDWGDGTTVDTYVVELSAYAP